MIVNRVIFVGNILLVILFLFYLCMLDFLFVFVMDEQRSIINDLGLLVAIMPFAGALFTFSRLSDSASLKKRILIAVLFFLALAVIGLIEYLWVATHFHALLGGKT